MEEAAPSRLLETLPARPPTPPRETHNELDPARSQSLLAASRCDSLDPRSSLQTPPSAQALLPGTKTGSTGNSHRKRVEFSAKADYKDAPVYPDNNGNTFGQQGHTTPPVAALPPSSSASQPAKSILKVTSYESSIPSTPTNIADMLASSVQQLVGADRDSKLDAYLMLARALKTSDNLPDRIALQSKMSLFTQFIQRDIINSKTPEGALDSTLVIAALDLLNTFLRFPAIASTLSNDFGVFIIDHCIRSFELSSVPRDVMRSLMRVVGLQSFSGKVMTSDRVGRLVSGLHNMNEQYESKNTIIMRSIIYRHLVKNNKMLMAVHLDWLPDLLADMISTGPHIREAAISLGLEAAFALGRERQASQRVMELLQATVDDECYLDYFAARLRTMTKNKAESSSVPQVWSVVTLFMRSLEKWDYFTNWLRIIQGCFNSADFRTRDEANYAWSRFAYALTRDNRPLSRKVLIIQTQAITSQLRRKVSGKQADDLRRVVLGCACNLFYYTMRDTRELDNIWDNSVKPVVLMLLEQSASEDTTRERRKANLTSACAILTGLIDCSAPRPWKEDHIAKSPTVAPEDLPAVDAKWIRRNADRVFDLVGPILEQTFTDLSTPRSAAQMLWRSVVGAVSAAAAKEVKVAPETAAFVGHAFSLLLKLWTNGVPAPSSTDNTTTTANTTSPQAESGHSLAAAQFLGAAREYLLTMVDSLGSLPFTEKQLSKDDKNSFVPVATPSQRASKGHSVSRTPLRHLFSILSSLPPGVYDNDDFADFVESVFAPFFSAKSSKGCRTLAFELLQMSPMDALCPYGPWQAVASRIASSMTPQSSASGNGSGSGGNSNGDKGGNALGNNFQYYQMSLSPGAGGNTGTPAGQEYREVVRVLERGLRSTPKLPWARWQSLFCTLCERVREDAGDAGLAMCVLDPLAKTIMELRANPTASTLSPTASRAVSELVSLASHPRDRQAVDAAKRRLWGPAIAASGPSVPFDLFDNLYRLANASLQQDYADYDSQKPASVEAGLSLLKEAAGFLERSNEKLSIKALVAMQDGLACWFQDEDMKIARTPVVIEAWSAVSGLLQRTAGDSAALPLTTLEPLLCSVFSSKNRHIVNNALGMWSHIYSDHTNEVDYPEKLKAALTTLQAFVDVSIPGLDATHVESNGAQEQLMFIDTQADLDVTLSSAEPNSGLVTTPLKRQEAPALTPLAASSPSYVNRASIESSKKTSSKRNKFRSTPPRPKHEDSQIEFTAIDSTDALPTSNSMSDAVNEDDNVNEDIDVVEESQVLTERQREVRERQRETNALYSDVMSSSPSGEAAARRFASRTVAAAAAAAVAATTVDGLTSSLPRLTVQPPSSDLPEGGLQEEEKQLEEPLSPAPVEDVALPERNMRATTPEQALDEKKKQVRNNGGDYNTDEDFIASTPTPRRGQALVFPVANDNEIDPPSSPPEPRRYPLLPEISSRSRSSSILDDWQFSSSPISGSPIAARHTDVEPELSLGGNAFVARLRAHADAAEIENEAPEQMGSQLPSGSVTTANVPDVVVEDSLAPAAVNMTVEISPIAMLSKTRSKTRSKPVLPMPSTPRQTRRRSALSQETSQNSSQAGDDDDRNVSFASFGGQSSPAVPASAPQSLPRTLRKSSRRAAVAASRMVAQSSPIRASGSSNHMTRELDSSNASNAGHASDGNSSQNSRGVPRYRLMAMPPPSMRDISFRMSDGEERSMLRIATELDRMHKQSQPSKPRSPVPAHAASSPPMTRRSAMKLQSLGESQSQSESQTQSQDESLGETKHDCITVWTSPNGKTKVKKEKGSFGRQLTHSREVPVIQENSEAADVPSSPLSSLDMSGSQRSSRRRKRKRSASVRDDDNDNDNGNEVDYETPMSSPLARPYARLRRQSQRLSTPVPAPPAEDVEMVDDTMADIDNDTTVDITADIDNDTTADITTEIADEQPPSSPVSSVPEDEEVHSQLALEQEVHSYRNTRASRNKGKVQAPAAVVEISGETQEKSQSPTKSPAKSPAKNLAKNVVKNLAKSPVKESVEEPAEGQEEPPTKKPRLAGILSMLRGSLSLLQAATLSRDDVSQIEDVCMDVKRALYDAERRGRDE
ncbi:telomere length regulator protein [Ophiostoma piceae UAMH 11346]|uniref:Telomere length regulator protein n=1 Tax=Ophiostoma piceae (strain UAMH 11346) TaxID=1262450 RepID=S3C0A6_OPHP1|nr:telomere length regulator protein [Ophiostoma piceae UAMH 11346]